MKNLNTTFEIDKRDKDFGYLTVEDMEGNFVELMVTKYEETVWTLNSFISGKIGNTRYRKDNLNQKLYTKDGKGRESKVAKEYIKELYTEGIKTILAL